MAAVKFLSAWKSFSVRNHNSSHRTINIPLVGVLQVAGLKATGLEGFVKAQVGRVFKNFEMKVTFGRLRED